MAMGISVRRDDVAGLARYAEVPAAFEVNEVVDVWPQPDGSGRFGMTLRRVAAPYVKDYDAAGEHPTQWATRFDVSGWGLFAAFDDQKHVGGAAVFRGSDALGDARDVAILWDIRVMPKWRRRGVGSALIDAAIRWGADKGCRQLQIETQNINVAACRFYAECGCVLRAAKAGAYPQFPDEVQLTWYIDIHPKGAG
jgi:GNAT superfamily N-acetyltransferase